MLNEYAPGPMARTGRPPDDDETRSEVVRLRATPAQVARWRAAADAAGEDLSAWLRGLADAASWQERGQ